MPGQGLNLQVPGQFTKISHGDGLVAQEWQLLFQTLAQAVYNSARSGPTASRPTSDQQNRWIGMPYFDTDLGYCIFLKSVSPDVWVDANGVLV